MIKYFISDRWIVGFDTKTRMYALMPHENITEPKPLAYIKKKLVETLKEG